MKFSKHFPAIAAFIAVCCMGWFCAAAGGIRWGTDGAGAIAFMTMSCACGAFAIALLAGDDA